jgi:hypothetical protein
MGSDVLKLAYARLQALVAIVLNTRIQCEALILQDEQNVRSEYDCAASKVTKPQHCLYRVL